MYDMPIFVDVFGEESNLKQLRILGKNCDSMETKLFSSICDFIKLEFKFKALAIVNGFSKPNWIVRPGYSFVVFSTNRGVQLTSFGPKT